MASISLEKIIKVLSVLTALFILLGNVYVFSFYKSFGINIYDYIQQSEVLTIFLPAFQDLVKVVLLFSLLPFAIVIFFWDKFKKRLPASTGSFRIARIRHKKITRLLTYPPAILILIHFLFDLINQHWFERNNSLLNLLSATSTFISISLVLFYILFKFIRKKINIHWQLFFILFICTQIFVFVTYFSDYKAVNLKIKEKSDIKYIFQFAELALITNDSLKFIGSTNENLFFFKRIGLEHKTIIFKKSALTAPIEVSYAPIFSRTKRRY